jgi:methionine--tRNA ligase beta chain
MKKPIIAFPDFDKLDIRVGEVKETALVEGSKNLIKMLVDLGEDYGAVEILSGLAKWYSPEEIAGKKYAFLANLEPKQMMGMNSNGMILVADDEEKPTLLVVDNKLPNGLVIR